MVVRTCVEVVVLMKVDFKILFCFASAEGNPTCQRGVLGSEEGQLGSAPAAAEQWPSGRGLQGQCTDRSIRYTHAGSSPSPAGMRAPAEYPSFAVLVRFFMCLLASSFSKSPKYHGELQNILGKPLPA